MIEYYMKNKPVHIIYGHQFTGPIACPMKTILIS